MLKLCSLVLVDAEGEIHAGAVDDSIVPLENAAKKIRANGEIKIGKETVKIAQAVILSNFRPAIKFRV